MKHIDEARLEEDTVYRVGYLSEFMGFGPDDIAAIHGAAVASGTARAGAGRCRLRQALLVRLQRSGISCRGNRATAGLCPRASSCCTQDHEMIKFRKEHLGRYLVALVTRNYDGKDAQLPRHGRQNAYAQSRFDGSGRAARADERPDGLRGRRPDERDFQSGPRSADGSSHGAGVQ